MACEALTAKGKPCRGGVVWGTRFCGPHQGWVPKPVAVVEPVVVVEVAGGLVERVWHDGPPRSFGPFDEPRGPRVGFEGGRWFEDRPVSSPVA
jgi:hypothetical protein